MNVKEITDEVEKELIIRESAKTSLGCIITFFQLLVVTPIWFYIIYSLIQASTIASSLVVLFWVWAVLVVVLVLAQSLITLLLSRK